MSSQEEQNKTSKKDVGVVKSALADWWDTEPFFVNEKGVKFWLDYHTTEYGKSRGLKDAYVWYTLEPDGTKTRLLTIDDKPAYENQDLEAMACHIDIVALAESYKEEK